MPSRRAYGNKPQLVCSLDRRLTILSRDEARSGAPVELGLERTLAREARLALRGLLEIVELRSWGSVTCLMGDHRAGARPIRSPHG